MCYKDVQLGMAKQLKPLPNQSVDSAGAKRLAPGNPNRAALIVGVNALVTPTTNPFVSVRSGGAAGPVLAVLTPASPTVVLPIELYGTGILDSVWVATQDVDGFNVFTSELIWIVPPGTI